MAAAVLQPLQSMTLDNGIMTPSPISPNASRHGRSRHGGSVSAKKTRGRGYSTADDRDSIISKALSFVLKRTVQEGEEGEGDEEKLVADAEGWVDCEEILARPQLESIQVTFPELQSLIASPSSKARFELKLKPESEEDDDSEASDYLIRTNPTKEPQTPTSATSSKITPLTATTENLPDMIVYETSYANYPLILASGGIKRAGGQATLAFQTIKIDDDGSEIREKSDADVSIFINLREIMEASPKTTWALTESGSVVTEGDAQGGISKTFWKKVVARRADIGVLYEDGEVRKEVPIGLRGKGVKAKKGGKGKGKGGLKEMKARSEDENSASDE